MYRFPQCSSAHSCITIGRLDPDSGQDQHDVEYMDARPDKVEMEEEIEHFLSRLEKRAV